MRLLNLNAAALLVAFGFVPPSYAKMAIHLRFPDGSTTKHLTPADVGTVVGLQVWAAIDNELSPEDNVNGTSTHEGLRNVWYSLISQRSSSSSIFGGLQGAQMRAPFNGSSSHAGQNVDVNSDGILDYGSYDTMSHNRENFARAGNPVFDEPALWEEFGVAPPTVNYLDNGIEFLVQTLAMRIDGLGNGDVTRIEAYIPSWALGTPPGSNWWQDSSSAPEPNGGIRDGLNNKTYFAGSSVTFTADPIPEPASVSLLALAALGSIIAVRRKSRLVAP